MGKSRDNSKTLNVIELDSSNNPVINSTGGVKIPVGTTSQRPTLGSSDYGSLRVNTDLIENQIVLEMWDGNEWLAIDAFLPIAATGGTTSDIVDANGDEYRVHVFTSGTSTFEITDSGTDGKIDILAVGGGGSAATTMSNHKGGGGGAGGLVFVPQLQLSAGTYSVTVGTGGASRPGSEASGTLLPGLPGTNTTFGSLITALGGGAGGYNADPGGNANINGGSGGGGHYEQAGGTGLQPSQSGYSGAPYGFGNDGASINTAQSGYGAGGAGKSGEDGDVTANSNSQTGAWAGGTGLYQVTIDSTVYNFNDLFNLASLGYGELVNGEYYFAGGGGAGIAGDGADTYGDGGYGGGGRGAYQQAGTDTGSWGTGSATGEYGIANTGGGGGGARGGSSGAGGSGIVIIRYPLKRIA